MSLPISYLESMLGQPKPEDDIIVFTVPGEDKPTFVRPSELKDLYIETRVQLNKCKETIKNLEEIVERERKSKEEKQKVCSMNGENTLTQSQTTGKKSNMYIHSALDITNVGSHSLV